MRLSRLVISKVSLCGGFALALGKHVSSGGVEENLIW